MTLYELIMTSPILSDDVKKKLIEQIANHKMNQEDINKIANILIGNKEKMDKITLNYIKGLDKLYAKHIKKDVEYIKIKEKKIENQCKELENMIEEGNPENIFNN